MMKKVFLAVLLGAGLTMSGCATTIKRPAFPVSEYEGLQKTGTNTITGQAFLKTRSGEVKFAAGNEITLNPVTSYSEQWYSTLATVQNDPFKKLEASDPRIEAYIKTTIADGSGRFKFSDVPDGAYFVTTKITWEVASGAIPTVTGGVVTKRVQVKDGQSIDIIVTQ